MGATPLGQRLDLGCVRVDRDDGVAQIRHAGRVNDPQIARSVTEMVSDTSRRVARVDALARQGLLPQYGECVRFYSPRLGYYCAPLGRTANT